LSPIRTRFGPVRAIVATYLLTEGRRSEVLGLEVGDVNFERSTVTIQSNHWRPLKRGHLRTIPLFPQLRRELRTYLADSGRIGGLLFPGVSTTGEEQPLSEGKLYDHLRQAAEEAGIRKRVTPQTLRVTYCAARLQSLDEGAPCAMITVQDEMGHSSMDMINRVYGRLGKYRRRVDGVDYGPTIAISDQGDTAPSTHVG
jgi:integrase